MVTLGVTALLVLVLRLWTWGRGLCLGAEPSHSGYGGRSFPSPSGAGDDDRSITVDSLDMDRDDTFRAVLRLIREFHSLEEPASIAPNRCKAFLAPVYGLQSELSTALHLPTSSLLRVSELQDLSKHVSFSSSGACVAYVPEFVAKTELAVNPLARSFIAPGRVQL